MALNIKDAETEQLAAELASRLSTTKTGAIRDALRARLRELTDESHREAIAARHYRVLETEIWPHTAGVPPITKAERENILGYGEDGI